MCACVCMWVHACVCTCIGMHSLSFSYLATQTKFFVILLTWSLATLYNLSDGADINNNTLYHVGDHNNNIIHPV
jgi:hypothetical protein